MARRALRAWVVVCVIGACGGSGSIAHGASLDEKGEIRLGVRAYTGARVGTEDTNFDIRCVGGAECTPLNTSSQIRRSLTFPRSAAGHLRQHRYFVEAEFDHDLSRLLTEGFGPFALLNDLPFDFKKLRYHLVYRGEGEGIYDYGPSEYRKAGFTGDPATGRNFFDPVQVTEFNGQTPNIGAVRRRLRRIGQQRHRVFQAFMESETGNLNLRIGRQILVWGETDAFRVVDNINPTDSSFGGFLVPLDERRVPLDMLVANYFLDDFWGIAPFYGSSLEGFIAVDSATGFIPGIPAGSPWNLPNLGDPSAVLVTTRRGKDRNFSDARYGGLFSTVVPVGDMTEMRVQLSHYYTFFDVPSVEVLTSPSFPQALDPEICSLDSSNDGTCLALAIQSAPQVQVTGLSSTFSIPAQFSRRIGLSGEPTIRTEFAYFKDEPRFTQGNIDPFVYNRDGRSVRPDPANPQGPPIVTLCNGPSTGREVNFAGKTLCSGGRQTGDSVNFVLGIDHNQYIRFLNPNTSFFITTQFFYKHLTGATKRGQFTSFTVNPNTPQARECVPGQDPGCQVLAPEGEVLPVPEFDQRPVKTQSAGAAQAILVHNPTDQYLQTLLIFTSYYSGQIIPSFTALYDWSGGVAVIPQITFSRDPFRFSLQYNFLYASRLKGGSGVSLLRDRDNLLFQLEYVI